LDDLRASVVTERQLLIDLEDPLQEISDPDVRISAREGSRVTLHFDPARVPAADLISRLTARYAVRDLFVENPPIEEIIARLYARNIGESVHRDEKVD
jgi:ABC-2 type transport system ATP-binding protein